MAVRAPGRGLRRPADRRRYLRIGGVAYDLPPEFDAKLRAILERTQIVLSDISKLLDRNRIFRDRMDGIGIITKEDAIS